METREYNINPIAKPRMTKRDKWLSRPIVEKYWDYKKRVIDLGIVVPCFGSHVLFFIPMPKTWSMSKKKALDGKPHKGKKDVDNLLKALLDCIYKDDSCVWDIRITKLWSYSGKIIIKITEGKLENKGEQYV